MKQSDVFRIIGWIDASLEMLQAYEGRLKGGEVRIRSLLMVVRNELSRDVIENTVPDKPGDGLLEGYDGHDVVESVPEAGPR